MGIYTEHWNKYKKDSRKGVFVLLSIFAIGLPGAAGLSLFVGRYTNGYPIYLHLALLVIWLIAFTITGIVYSRVTCPGCNTVYTRGKGLCDCPQCGLGMLQDDPSA